MDAASDLFETLVGGFITDAFNVLKEILNWIISIVDTLFTWLGIMFPKKMRLHVRVLSYDQGKPLISQSSSDWAKLELAWSEARRIFRAQTNVVTYPALASQAIRILNVKAPKEALEPGCDGEALRDELGFAGKFFRKHKVNNVFGLLIGYGAPITVFIVQNVRAVHGQERGGCSAGAAADYVTVDLGAIQKEGTPNGSWTLAHEVGHACNATIYKHWGAGDTLMRASPNGRRDYLKRWMKANVRASRHVTFM